MDALNSSDLLAQGLAACGVRLAFGMPGGAVLPLLEAFRRVGIEFVLVRHEGSAGFMADALAQLGDAPGVCLSTLGPGATNLVSGAAGALLERSRVLCITGQIGTGLRSVYTHQILDQQALFAPVCKRSFSLDAGRARQQIPQILHCLLSGAPGPVHLDLPADVAKAAQPEGLGALRPVSSPRPASLGPAAEQALGASQRPVFVVGCGELGDAAAAAVVALAERTGAPVITTYRAKGMIDEAHPLSAGAFGLSPVVDAHQRALLERADLLIAVGLDIVELRPHWLPGWPEALPVLSIDPHGQPDLLGALCGELLGSVVTSLDLIGPRLSRSVWSPAELQAHRSALEEPFDDGPDGPAETIRAVQRACPDDVLLTLDVGAHRITACHVWRCARPRRQLQSNGFSSMATGLPMAIAARLHFPETPVVCITGDMGLQMALGELGICQERGLDLVVVYLADMDLSLIHLKQERLRYPTSGVLFANPHVEQLAAAFGGQGRSVQGAEAVEQAVREALAAGGLQLIEAVIDPSGYRRQM